MKILWINQASINSSISFADRIEVPKYLEKFGHDVIMVVPEVGRKRNENNRWWNNVFVIRVPFNRVQIPFFLFQLLILFPFLVIKYKPNVIITDYASVPAIAIFAFFARLNLTKNRFVLDIRTCPVQLVGIGGKWRRFQYLIGLSLAKYTYQGITVITEELKQEIIHEVNYFPEKIGIWNSGASIELFDPEKTVSKSRKEFGLENKFIVMYHGTFRPERGIETAIKAVINLQKKGYPISIFIMGDGPLFNTLNGILHKTNFDGSVILHPPVNYEEVPQYIKMADIGINIPKVDIAWWKSQSFLKVMEYLSMEKPVVLSNIIAHQEVVGFDKPFVSFVDDNNVETVEKAILKFYLIREEIEQMGKEARKLIMSRFTWEIQAKKFEKYLLKILTN